MSDFRSEGFFKNILQLNHQKKSYFYRCVPNFNCEKTSTEEEVFGSSTLETTASCFDETPNGLQKFTKSKTHTCCAEENINVGKRNDGSLDDYPDNFCEDHDNYRLVPVLTLGLGSTHFVGTYIHRCP